MSVIIPALDEEDAIGSVIDEIPRPPVSDVIVVDNGSTDRTAGVAREHGATVVREDRRGYGRACLRGIAALPDDTDTVVFLDGDHSDFPEQIPDLIAPIAADEADMVIGSRALGECETGALTPVQIFGNWLACTLMRLIYGHRYTDLGPFRAISREALERLEMQDLDFGWTVEMQIKALKNRMRVAEIPARYRCRIGRSKISGTIMGSVRAGHKIIATILRHAR
ncbi:MAG: glycosyltransferase family 2 protein [Armatimonadota bacterium]